MSTADNPISLDDPLSADQPLGTLLSETEFHERSQRVASALLDEVANPSGKIKQGVDLIRVERALAGARGVIDAANKARDSLRQAREDQVFEQSVITAARTLPREVQETFMTTLEQELTKASAQL